MKKEVFAERLQESMRAKRMKQIDLVNKTGIRKGTISNYVNGKYAATGRNLVSLARALDVTAEWLMGGNDERSALSDEEKRLFDILQKTEEIEVSAEEQQIIFAYRKADPSIRSAVKKLLDIWEEQ